MKLLLNYINSIYKYSKRKCIECIIFMMLDGITGSIGILMLIPLLSLTGIVGDEKYISTSGNILDKFENIDKSNLLIIVLAIYIVLIVLQAIISRKLAVLNTSIVQGYTEYLRVSLFENIVKAEWSYLSGKRKSDITNAFTSEISKIASGTVFLLKIIAQTILALFQIGIAFIMSVPLTIFVLVSGGVVLAIMRTTLRESKKLGGSLRIINQNMMSSITEHLNSVKEVKSYGIEATELESFEDIANNTYQNITDFTKLQSKTAMYYKIFAAFVISILFYFASVFLEIEPIKLLIIVYIFARLWPVFTSFQSNLQNIYIMLPSFSALQKLLEELKEKKEKLDKVFIKKNNMLNESVDFREVSFAYDINDEFELKNISFEIPARKMVAIVGKSGSGKSTLVDLLLGLLKPISGGVFVDNVEINDDVMQMWRQSIGYVPQDPFLYNSTIRENLSRFTPSATMEQMIEALILSDAYEFVEKLPLGIDTIVGDNGVRLSGGQRQRIVLARAILRKPDILVLDEATSSLDNESEAKIKKAVEALAGKTTVVVIAHRLSTIKNADHIIMLENGRIVETGTYYELLQKKEGYFNTMVNSEEVID